MPKLNPDVQVLVYMPRELRDTLKDYAESRGLSTAKLLVTLAKDFVHGKSLKAFEQFAEENNLQLKLVELPMGVKQWHIHKGDTRITLVLSRSEAGVTYCIDEEELKRLCSPYI